MSDNCDDIKLVFFSALSDRHFRKISDSIPEAFSKNQISYCSNINDFSIAIKDILFGLGIILVVARNKTELNKIYQMSEKLKDHSLILILSDEIEEMAPQAIRLYPRYTTYIKNDYNDVFLVLNKMMKNIENKTKGESNGRSCRCN